MEENIISIEQLCSYFAKLLHCSEPSKNIDLVTPSLILGYLENKIVSQNLPSAPRCKKQKTDADGAVVSCDNEDYDGETFPVVSAGGIEKLRLQFLEFAHKTIAQPKTCGDISTNGGIHTDRLLIKSAADSVWKSLSQAPHKDKWHIQTLFSFLTGKKLDCMGLAFTVVAVCSVLGCDDVHLAVSEDHAWISFADDKTAEITWNGKRQEGKRGEEIGSSADFLPRDCWLYLGGEKGPVVCDRKKELAAIITCINPGLSTKSDSHLLRCIQRDLLLLFYQEGVLSTYPMGLIALADLQEICPVKISSDESIVTVDALYKSAILTAQHDYANMHVYPYTQYAYYLLRNDKQLEALKLWVQVFREVLPSYTYHREDEELYKEIREIVCEFLPQLSKLYSESSEFYIGFVYIVDGLCRWEQGGKTPVISATWSKAICRVFATVSNAIRLKHRLKSCYEDSTSRNVGAEANETETVQANRDLLGADVLSDLPEVGVRSRKLISICDILNRPTFNSASVKLSLESFSF